MMDYKETIPTGNDDFDNSIKIDSTMYIPDLYGNGMNHAENTSTVNYENPMKYRHSGICKKKYTSKKRIRNKIAKKSRKRNRK